MGKAHPDGFDLMLHGRLDTYPLEISNGGAEIVLPYLPWNAPLGYAAANEKGEKELEYELIEAS